MLTVCLAGLARQTRPADEIIVFWAVGALMGHPPLFGSNFAMQSAVWPRIRGKVSRGLRTTFAVEFARERPGRRRRRQWEHDHPR